MTKVTRRVARIRRHVRVRKSVSGTSLRPRLNVYRSASHIYAQVIDDLAGNTLAAASSLEGDVPKNIPKTEQAKIVGQRLAERCREAQVTTVLFDRGGYLYHGRVKALADGAREGGLNF